MPTTPPPTSVPEAPKEVIIRTMASDLEMMAKSGGTFAVQKPAAQPAPIPVQTPAPADETKLIKIAVFGGVGILAIGILVLAGYYITPFIFPPKTVPAPTPTLPTAQPTTNLPSTPSLPSPVFSHQSFLRIPADQIIQFTLRPVSAATELQTFSQQISEALSGAEPNAVFFEIENKDADGKPLAWTKFLSFANIKLLTPEFFLKNFNQDFTAFIYKDKNGAWPGYILELTGGKNPLFFQSEISKLESDSAAINAFYLNPPGASSADFQDSQLVGEPIRTLSFEQNGAVFVYGWFHSKYLVISTSLIGLKEAVKRL